MSADEEGDEWFERAINPVEPCTVKTYCGCVSDKGKYVNNRKEEVWENKTAKCKNSCTIRVRDLFLCDVRKRTI